MPSAKVLKAKEALVADLNEKIKGSVSGVLVDYRGLTVEQDTKLRAEMRKAGVEYKVIKNTLIKRALGETGLEDLYSCLENPTAIAISAEDAVAPAKVLTEFAAKNDALQIKAGYLEGQVMNAAEIEELGKIPPKDVLIAKVLGGLNAPLTSLAIVLNQIAEQKSAQGAE